MKRINNNVFFTLYTQSDSWHLEMRVYAGHFIFFLSRYSLLGEWTMLNFSEVVNKTDCLKHQDHWVSTLLCSQGPRECILISFRRCEKLRVFLKTANWLPLQFFPGSLGLVFVYMDSSSISLLRMHNHNFLFAFFHASQFSMITPHIL